MAVLSDIGKIVLYHGCIVKRDPETNRVLIRTGYKLEDRLKNNPSWTVPASVELTEDGKMNVWYSDGDDTVIDWEAATGQEPCEKDCPSKCDGCV